MLTNTQQITKRVFDLAIAIPMLVFCFPIILTAWMIATIESRSNGLFIQQRIGKNGQLFNLYKIKTMRPIQGINTTVTTVNDDRILRSGTFFRKTKIDELPQLFNVLIGTMSLVGPRPDVPGFADQLIGDDKEILLIAPGITGPASIKYKNEEEILASKQDPEAYNATIIWPDKVKINRAYIKHWSLQKDIIYLYQTIVGHE